jgi:quinol monooxygenase YgiN
VSAPTPSSLLDRIPSVASLCDPMAYVVIARWTARAGEEDRARALLVELAELTRAERGCRLFQPTVDPDDPREMTILEIYDDEAAFNVHSDSAHFKRYVLEEAVPLLEQRSRTFLDTIDDD